MPIRQGASIRFLEGKAMAPCAASNTPTRLGRALHWLFPSRRAVVAVAVVEVAASLLGLPPLAHLAAGLVLHVFWVVIPKG